MPPAVDRGAVTSIRVATYNTRDFLDDHALAARVVRAIDPDVLCLQEVPRRLLGGLRVARFARACDLHWAGRHRGSGGTTVLTSHRVRSLGLSHHRLPVRFPDRTRGFAVARVGLPGGAEVVAVSAHLGLRAGERVAHARLLLAHPAAAEAVAGSRHLVVGADLNEEEGGAASLVLVSGGLLRRVSPGTPTFPARSPRRRLDVVLATEGLVALTPRQVAVPAAALVAASDHLPTWVDLVVG